MTKAEKNPSSETQGLLAGTMQYFWAKVYAALEVNFRPKISHRPG